MSGIYGLLRLLYIAPRCNDVMFLLFYVTSLQYRFITTGTLNFHRHTSNSANKRYIYVNISAITCKIHHKLATLRTPFTLFYVRRSGVTFTC